MQTEQKEKFAQEGELLRVGVFSSTHGIKGEVKVFPTTDDNKRFLDLKQVFLDLRESGKGLLELELEKVRFFKQMVIVKFKGYDDINQIEKYRGSDLLIRREDAVALAENECFIFDVIGSEAVTEDGLVIGTVKEILTTGANDVYVICLSEEAGRLPEEVRAGKAAEPGQELLLPSIPSCILSVDVEAKKVVVRVPEGLF